MQATSRAAAASSSLPVIGVKDIGILSGDALTIRDRSVRLRHHVRNERSAAFERGDATSRQRLALSGGRLGVSGRKESGAAGGGGANICLASESIGTRAHGTSAELQAN